MRQLLGRNDRADFTGPIGLSVNLPQQRNSALASFKLLWRSHIRWVSLLACFLNLHVFYLIRCRFGFNFMFLLFRTVSDCGFWAWLGRRRRKWSSNMSVGASLNFVFSVVYLISGIVVLSFFTGLPEKSGKWRGEKKSCFGCLGLEVSQYVLSWKWGKGRGDKVFCCVVLVDEKQDILCLVAETWRKRRKVKFL